MKNTENRLGVTLSGIPLDNPVIPASGTFGFGRQSCMTWTFWVPFLSRERRWNPVTEIRCPALRNARTAC